MRYCLNFNDVKFLEIGSDYPEDEETKITQVYLKYKRKNIPLSQDEEKLLDKVIKKYEEKNGVLYGFVNEVLGSERIL